MGCAADACVNACVHTRTRTRTSVGLVAWVRAVVPLCCCAVVQRERRGWTGDAQTSSEEAMLNFGMQRFYTKYLDDIRDDQLRYNGNHGNDTGAVADVIPYDGIGGNPGCPVWQVCLARAHTGTPERLRAHAHAHAHAHVCAHLASRKCVCADAVVEL